MLKIVNNEILVGTDENGYTHYGYVTKNEVTIENSVLKIKSLEFSLENKQYEINVSDNSVLTYTLNDVSKHGNFINGTYKIDATNLTNIKFEIDGVVKHYKLKDNSWTEYTPAPPLSEVDKLKNQVDQLALAILTMEA